MENFDDNKRRLSSPASATKISPYANRRRYSSPVRRASLVEDRHIPNRISSKLEAAFDLMEQDDKMRSSSGSDMSRENQGIMNNLIRSELLGQPLYSPNNKSDIALNDVKNPLSTLNVLKYSQQKERFSDESQNPNTLIPLSPQRQRSPTITSSKYQRRISRIPFKVLDAPALKDDFYLNLVDWGNSNILAVGLGSYVYLWSASTSKVTKLCDLGSEDTVTAVAWAIDGIHIAIGTNLGKVLIWDSNKSIQIKELGRHAARVGSIAWSRNVIASGSRDKQIFIHNFRITVDGDINLDSNSIIEPTNSILSSSPSSMNNNNTRNQSSFYSNISNTTSSSNSNINRSNNSNNMSFDSMLSSVTTNSSSSTLSNNSNNMLSFQNISVLSTNSSSSNNSNVSFHQSSNNSDLNDSLFSNNTTISTTSLTTAHSATSSDTSNSVILILTAHKQEVCGLKWSPDFKQLASGGNDNKLYVWNIHCQAPATSGSEPCCVFGDHLAAVKALTWSPHQAGLLASGGGTADRHIRFWNTLSGSALHRIDTGSQVCNLMWSRNINEIVSTHGYSLNQVIVWKYPSMQKLATLTGHTFRVLYLAMSPDGETAVTGAGDETLRFWNLFPEASSRSGWTGVSVLIPNGGDIR